MFLGWFWFLIYFIPLSQIYFLDTNLRFVTLCGEEAVAACRRWLHEGNLPTAHGDTNIVLIPNYDHHRTMRDLRLISLCKVVYKILAKTLAIDYKESWINAFQSNSLVLLQGRQSLIISSLPQR